RGGLPAGERGPRRAARGNSTRGRRSGVAARLQRPRARPASTARPARARGLFVSRRPTRSEPAPPRVEHGRALRAAAAAPPAVPPARRPPATPAPRGTGASGGAPPPRGAARGPPPPRGPANEPPPPPHPPPPPPHPPPPAAPTPANSPAPNPAPATPAPAPA